MRLRNKRTGEVYDFKITPDYDDAMSGWKIENKAFGIRYYSDIAELNSEWEDYKGPKEYWYISDNGYICSHKDEMDSWDEFRKRVGNYFETKEEADKAVEKLGAYKRLRNRGFKFEGIHQDYTKMFNQRPFIDGRKYLYFNKLEDDDWLKENWEDLKLLFSGGEDETD